MKKIIWFSLNPIEKFNRFCHLSWCILLAIFVIYFKFEYIVATIITFLLVIFSYMEYKRLKKIALTFKQKQTNS